jgi:membrane protein implicated in regulation of membrane protease activity
MNPALKYALGRVGLFVAVAVPAVLLLPRDMNFLLKLMIALVLSAVLSFFLLRRWRQEIAERMSENARRRMAEKERLRSALAGEDHPRSGPNAAQPRDATGDDPSDPRDQ